MSSLWNYLNSPELVFKVQTFLGVEKSDNGDDQKKKFRVKNKFLYYLFLLGTELGDEIFYGLFIPIMFINVDSYLGRRFVFHWFVNMYVGQALKEVFKEERPKQPAIQMQSKWSNEFSLPSTHAMGSLSISASILYFALDRYDVNLWLGIAFIVIWVGVISLSRVYLGMHTVLDLVLGIVISVILLAVTLPITNFVMDFLATSVLSPAVILILPVMLIVYFPVPNVWTPTRGDTCVVAAVFSGIELGTWINYHTGLMTHSTAPYPLSLEFGSFYALAVRTVVGLAIVGLTEFLGKLVTFYLLSKVIDEDPKALKSSENSVDNTKKTFVDLSSKFITYCFLGFNCLVLVPIIFTYLNVQRKNFSMEL